MLFDMSGSITGLNQLQILTFNCQKTTTNVY